MSGRPAFQSDRLESFWRFVGERQRAWLRRVVLREAPPWTDDEAIGHYRFTNVYRLLDPGTQYAIGEIMEREEPATDRLFNLLLYRLVGRQSTHAALGFQHVETFDPFEFERWVRSRLLDHGEPVFTGAYVVSGYSGMGGSDKVENVARLLAEVRDRFDEFYARVEDAKGPQDVYAAIRGLPGFGNFLAYQVFVDCTYPLSVTGDRSVAGSGSLLPFSPNGWAAAGPGAKRGLDVLTVDGAERSALGVMRWLSGNQVDEFARLGIDFDWLRDARGDRIELSLPDIQNCCCEFFRYHGVASGKGRARRRFRPGERRSAEALRALYDGYPISVKESHYAADVQ